MTLRHLSLVLIFLSSLSHASEGLLVRPPTLCVQLLAHLFERPGRLVQAFHERQQATQARLKRWQREYVERHRPVLESIAATLADELQATTIAFAHQLKERSVRDNYLAGMIVSTTLLNESRDVRNIQWIFSDQFHSIAEKNIDNRHTPPTKEMFEPFTAQQFYEMLLEENREVEHALQGQSPLNEFMSRINRAKPLETDEVAVLVSSDYDAWGYLALGPVSDELAPWVEHVFGMRNPQGVLVKLTSPCAQGAGFDAVDAGTKKKKMTLNELKVKQMRHAEKPNIDVNNVVHYADKGSPGRFVYISLVAMRYFNNERVRFVIPRAAPVLGTTSRDEDGIDFID